MNTYDDRQADLKNGFEVYWEREGGLITFCQPGGKSLYHKRFNNDKDNKWLMPFIKTETDFAIFGLFLADLFDLRLMPYSQTAPNKLVLKLKD